MTFANFAGPTGSEDQANAGIKSLEMRVLSMQRYRVFCRLLSSSTLNFGLFVAFDVQIAICLGCGDFKDTLEPEKMDFGVGSWFWAKNIANGGVHEEPPCILVTGGAGYIGSHTTLQLLMDGYKVVIIDNLDNSCEVAVERVVVLAGKYGKNLTFFKVGLRSLFAAFPFLSLV